MAKKKPNTREDLGRYFGYPECCIKAFVQLKHWGSDKKRKLDGTGYVPCDKCNKKTAQQLRQAIAKKREHHQPFPKDSEF